MCSDSGKGHVGLDQLYLSLAAGVLHSNKKTRELRIGEIPYSGNTVLNTLLVSVDSGRSRRNPSDRCAPLRKPGSSLHGACGWHSSESHC